MRRLRFVLLATGSAALLLGGAGRASATDFFIYKASLKIEAQTVIINPTGFDVVVKRKLGPNDVVNLALGRPLGTKVDKNTEILAGAGTYANDAAQSKLIVFDQTQNGVAQIKAVVAAVNSLDFTNAFLASKSEGVGFGAANLLATTVGDPATNGFLASTFNCNGAGSGTHDPFGGNAKVSGKGTGGGRLRFLSGGQLFDGIVVKAQGKVSGKPIGGFTQ